MLVKILAISDFGKCNFLVNVKSCKSDFTWSIVSTVTVGC